MSAGASMASTLDTELDTELDADAEPSIVPSIESFCWLLSPVAPDVVAGAAVPPPASAEHVDAIACELLHAWQVAPAVVPLFIDWIQPAHRDRPSVALLQARARAVAAFAELQNERIREVVGAFDAAGLPYALLKSAALRFQVYDHPAERCGEDFDLAVARRDLGAARRVLEGMGYEPAQWSEAALRYQQGDPAFRAFVEARHHELGFLIRRERVHGLAPHTRDAVFDQLALRPWLWHLTPEGALATYLLVDVHHGLSLDIPADALLATRCAADLDGTPAWVPSPAWSAFFSIYKLYWEGVHHYREGVHHYADLARLMPRLTATDVVELAHIVETYNLRAAAYFVLRRLTPMFGVVLDPAVDALIDACAVPNVRTGALDQNDYGDVWPKLWGQR
jgi:putative nucleotidyltransferase-like protein